MSAFQMGFRDGLDSVSLGSRFLPSWIVELPSCFMNKKSGNSYIDKLVGLCSPEIINEGVV